MEDLILTEIFKAALSTSKEILGNRIKSENEKLLDIKKKKVAKKRIESYQKNLMTDEFFDAVNLLEEEKVNAELVFIEDTFRQTLKTHFSELESWSNFIGFRDSSGRKKLNSIYVDLDTYLMPVNSHFSEVEKNSKKQLEEAIFNSSEHAVILGQPGAGKTTSMKKICARYLNIENNRDYRFPLLIRLRDLNKKQINVSQKSILIPALSSLLSMKFDWNNGAPDKVINELMEVSVVSVLEDICPIIILDGFDEITQPDVREIVLQEIRHLTANCRRSKVLVTCRAGEFNYELENASNYEISSLTEKQIEIFTKKWLVDEEQANSFLSAIKKSPFADTTIKPLSLAHLCAIYERTESIPEKPKTIYKKIVNLMLEEWDEQRSIKRISRYASFEPDRKFEFLTNLSFELTVSGNSSTFDEAELITSYRKICDNFNLPESQAKATANELESHTGLFLQSGYLKFEFAHKSLQEYLAAEYIVKLPSLLRAKSHINVLAAELAIAVSLSSSSSMYFAEFVFNFIGQSEFTESFYNAFFNRLLLEKPDFYACEELELAFLSLLSAHPRHAALVELIYRTYKTNHFKHVLKYYDVEKVDFKDTLFLKMRRKHKNYKLKSKLHIPSGDFKEKIIKR